MATPASPQPRRPQQPSTPAPQPVTPGRLSAHFDPLPFPARTSALARYARALTPAAYTALHRALDAGNDHERHTALFLAVARRDLTTVSAALADPQLRRRALSAATRLPVPEPPLEQLALSPIRALRHDTYRVLKRSRRQALAEALLPRVYDQYGSDDAARLLTACSAATADTWLPRLEPPHGVLRTLARTAPMAVARHIADRYEQLVAQDRRALAAFDRRYRALVCLTARQDSHAGVVLVRAVPHLLEGKAALAVLRRPADVLEALRAAAESVAARRAETDERGAWSDSSRAELCFPPGPLPRTVRKALQRLPQEDLMELAERCTAGGRSTRGRQRHEVAPDGILMLLPPAERRRSVTRRADARRASCRCGATDEGCRRGLDAVPVSALAALAQEDRAELTASRRQRWTRRPRAVTRLGFALPLEQAEPALLDVAAQPHFHYRALAWPALLASAELNGDPAEFVRIATLCERAWHDRDEVRLRTLTQLAGTPRHLLDALPANLLRDVTLATVQAADTSQATLLQADRLLRRTTLGAAARQDYEKAAHSAGLLCEVLTAPRHQSTRQGRGPVPPLPLDAAAAQALWEAAAPRTKNTPTLCVPLAGLLAPNLPDVPELDQNVHSIALTADDPALAARAAEAWVAPRGLREQRCAELVVHDSSFASVPRILHTLATRRTDLLDQVFEAAEHGLTGHLRPRATPWVPSIAPTIARRWLPEQRRAQNRHYARVAQDETAPLHTRATAAAHLRTPDVLAALATDVPQPVAAAALTALGATEELLPSQPELPSLLLHHAGRGGARGRAATAALRRLLTAHHPTSHAVALLRGVLTGVDGAAPGTPVGSRKEAARALGELPGSAAFEALLAAWDTEGQHCDVRAVLARHLLPHLDRPDVADRLAAHVAEPAIREIVLHARVHHHSPPLGPPPDAYLSFLIRLLGSAETDRETTVRVCRLLPDRSALDPESALRALAALITDPERDRVVWGAAAEAVGRLPTEGPGARRLLLPLWAELGGRARAGSGTESDSVAGRADALSRLVACADTFQNAARPGYGYRFAVHGPVSGRPAPGGDAAEAGEQGDVIDGLASALEEVGLHARAAGLRRTALVGAVLRGHRYQPDRWDRFLRSVEERAALSPEHPRDAVDSPPQTRDEVALTAVRDLLARRTPEAARLALDLVRAVGERSSWPAPWRAQLDALRRHQDPETAAEALLVDAEGRARTA
ncbi:hypothetical protein [Streptomyces sp. Da 82-17]|uniref:hypothetical protein n=1 Tax=Streptomyces sp. Da 82-17 TaxID=3377116 RepID=UPI0038D45B10